ncbi:MAG: UDP-N-acetylmuramate dehydrogenase [Syntrophaceae bacterium]|nr:UDP-N-acetylmuramate dehydrogenase [Syntrophaceae bacterium]
MMVENNIKETLKDIYSVKILYDEPMSRHASLCVGGKADALVILENEEQLIGIVRLLTARNIDYLPAGNLTNIIVRDGGYRGAILLMKGLKKTNHQYSPESGHTISAQAGASLSAAVSLALAQELSGMEFCAGIPGSVGGAVWMNAGAYGKEMKDVIENVYLLDAQGEKKEMSREEITFGYRKTELPPGAIIMGASFKLEKGNGEEIKKSITEIMKWRQEKHPLEYPNAGSIFKNIPGQPAGRIIEEMGMKGQSIGNARISPKHANFIVNTGKATASDVLRLISLVQKKAREEKRINLETEVVIIGDE